MKNLLITVNKIIHDKNLSWSFNIEHARFTIKYAIAYDSISEIIFSEDFPLINTVKPKTTYNSEYELIKELKIENWSDVDFIISAILFYIQYEIRQGSCSFFSFSINLMPLLFNNSTLSDAVFNVLEETNLFLFLEKVLYLELQIFLKKH